MTIIENITDRGDEYEVLARAYGDAAEEELDATCQIALDAVITGWHWTICDDRSCECMHGRIEG